MAFNAGSIVATLELDLSKFEGALRRARGAAGNLNGRLGGIGRGLQNLNRLGGKAALALGAAGLAGAAIAGGVAISQLTGFVREGINAQAEYEQAVVALSSTLRGQGVAGVEQLVGAVETFAAEFQRATGSADNLSVTVASRLAALGVEAQRLPEATETVIDFANALGLNVETAARAFGQALTGNAATLARYLGDVRGLTKEQLQAGEAFDVAREKFGGFTRALGETFTGRLNRLRASFEDFQKRFGAAFIEALGPVLEQLQTFFDFFVEGLQAGTPEFEALREVAVGFGEALQGLIDNAIPAFFNAIARVQDLRAGFQSIIAFSANAQAAVLQFVADVEGAIGDVLQRIANTVAQLPLVGEQLAQVFQRLADQQARAAAEAEGVAEEFRIVAGEAEKTREELEGSANAIREFGNSIEEARKDFEVTEGAARKTRDSVGGLPAAVGAAADEAKELGAALDQAADAAEGIDESLGGGRGGAGGGGAGGAGGGPTRRRLNLDDPFAAASEVQAAEDFLRQTTQGGLVAGVANFQINAARNFANAVRREASAAFNQQLAQFSSEVVAELNRAGIFDPGDRSRILRERVAEAERLGILAPPPSGRVSTVR